MNQEGFIEGNQRYWYDICVKCFRIVSPRHSCCPNCGGIEYKGTIRNKEGLVKQKPLGERPC